jgi:acetate kinase
MQADIWNIVSFDHWSVELGKALPQPQRTRISDELDFLGVVIDERHNTTNAGVISAENNQVIIRVMHTNKDVMIAISVCHILRLPI